jgi:hypothetical protein
MLALAGEANPDDRAEARIGEAILIGSDADRAAPAVRAGAPAGTRAVDPETAPAPGCRCPRCPL